MATSEVMQPVIILSVSAVVKAARISNAVGRAGG